MRVSNNTYFLLAVVNHVRDLLITHTDSGSMVECDFFQQSTATACLVTVACEDDEKYSSHICELNIRKGSKSSINNCHLNCLLFAVSAFDVNSNPMTDVSSITKHNVSLVLPSLQPAATECEYMYIVIFHYGVSLLKLGI